MRNYINTSEEAGIEFYKKFVGKGKITMLNLLKFKPMADYDNLRQLKPATKITGEQAYKLYMHHTLPELEKANSTILYYGSSNKYLIGPSDIIWDAMLLVEHQSVEQFIAFAKNENYLKFAGHRTAALDDSRLLPSVKTGIN